MRRSETRPPPFAPLAISVKNVPYRGPRDPPSRRVPTVGAIRKGIFGKPRGDRGRGDSARLGHVICR